MMKRSVLWLTKARKRLQDIPREDPDEKAREFIRGMHDLCNEIEHYHRIFKSRLIETCVVWLLWTKRCVDTALVCRPTEERLTHFLGLFTFMMHFI